MLEYFKDILLTFSKHVFSILIKKSIPGLKSRIMLILMHFFCIILELHFVNIFVDKMHNCSFITLPATELQTLKNVTNFATLYETVL